LLQQLHDDPVRPSSMGRGTLRAQHPYIRSVLDSYNLAASAYEAGSEVACSFCTTQGNQPARPSSPIATATLTSPVLSAPMENVVRESGLMQNEKGNQSCRHRTQRYL
jgi:hypothetical protein